MMSTRVPLVYMAHPVGHGPVRALNVQRAKLWVRTLVQTVEHCMFSAPWLPYVEVLDEETYRERGMRDDLHALMVHHAITSVGGLFSPGMCTEWELFGSITPSRPRVDLTMLPANPLELTAQHRQFIREAFSVIT